MSMLLLEMSANVSNESDSEISTGIDAVSRFAVPLSVVGILINLAAVAFVIRTLKIKQPMKICLINLIASDCLILMGLLSVSLEVLSYAALTPWCPIVMGFLMVPYPVAYTAVLGMAVYSYVAVFKATKFNQIITLKKAVLVSVATWLFIISLTTIAISLSSGTQVKKCSVVSMISPVFLVVLSVHCILCSCSMVGLNIAVIFRIRSLRLIGINASDTATINEDQVSTNARNLSSLHHLTPNMLQPSSAVARHRQCRLRVSYGISERGMGINCGMPSNQSQALSPPTPYEPHILNSTLKPGLRQPDSSHLPMPQTGDTHQNTVSATSSVASSILNTSPISQPDQSLYRNCETQHPPVIIVSHHNPSELRSSYIYNHRHPGHGLTLSALGSQEGLNRLEQISPVDVVSQSSGNESRSSEGRTPLALSPKIRSAIMTLTILAFWNAILTLPVVAIWIWMSILEDDVHDTKYYGIAQAVYILGPINSISNPFLYAWRFVSWRKLCRYYCTRYTLTVEDRPM